MKQKKVLVIATTPLCKDGLTEVLIRTAEVISNTYQVDFALGESAEKEILNRIEGIGKVYELISRKKRLIQYIRELQTLVEDGQYEIIHIHGNSSTMAFDLTACRKAAIRITHCHNQARQPVLKSLIFGTTMNRLATHPVACSQSAGEALYTKPFTVIRNGIDTERFQFSEETRRQTREKLGLADAYIIGHIGRFTEQKNHKRLIHIFEHALRKRKDAVLLLCGSGETEEEIRTLVKERNLERKVRFAGVVSEPQDYLMAMDILVLPSLFEGLPLVGVEAQATGLPCVFADTITEEAAILPEVEFLSLDETDERWAEVICKNRKNHREAAAKQVEEAGYGMDTVREQIRELYRSAWGEND